MNKKRERLVLGAAVAGILGAALSAPVAAEKKGKKMEVVPCYGVNKCAGTGACGGKTHKCSGKNSCKGQGWLYMPKESCEKLEGGSLTPVDEKKADKKEKAGKPDAMKDMGSQ